ncbi:MAG: S41 family peptidase [Flavisolibacter sp.]
MLRILAFVSAFSCLGSIYAQQFTKKQLSEDFEYFWSTINTDYCYFDKKATDWNRVKEIYANDLDTISTRKSFVFLLEKMFRELYDNHASLSTNYPESQKLVPTGTDVWAEYKNNKAVILEVRRNSGADHCGLRAGMEVISFNDLAIDQAIQEFIPKSVSTVTPEARNFALQVLLAGRHNEKRKITVLDPQKRIDFFPDDPQYFSADSPSWLDSKRLEGNIGYIRINNRLGENELIPLFDSVLDGLMDTKAMILDMRLTPSGGNTTVARAVLSRFISKEGFYQKHELTQEEKMFGVKRSWEEIVSPRKTTYTKALVVLADHWTGSVGEAMVIGLDGLKRVKVIGTQMARLNGAVYSYRLPNTGIGFNFPAEKLFHVNGTPRENFEPHIRVNMVQQKPGSDEILDAALRYLRQRDKHS